LFVNENDMDRYHWRTGQPWSGAYSSLQRRVTLPVRLTSLFRYLLRAIGVMFVIGMITTLFLQINSVVARSHQAAPPSHAMRH
jgi:hypothetical protein